jgi:hypothetical protein
MLPSRLQNMFIINERKKIVMPEEKESTITTPEAAVISALSEEELKKIAGGAPFTPEQLAMLERITTSKAPTSISRGTQAAFGTALGFGANDAGILAGNSVHKNK